MLVDTELKHLPAALRWREWMGRVEAVIFAASEPVTREVLARVVGKSCNIDLIIDDIRDELRGRPYELVSVAGAWQHWTRKNYADAIRAATGQGAGGSAGRSLSQLENLVLMCIAYFQPITRAELSSFFGKEVSRDLIGVLRSQDFIASGPRSPTQGAPYTYVTTRTFMSHFGLNTLRDLPDFDALEDAGLLSKEKLLAGESPFGLLGARTCLMANLPGLRKSAKQSDGLGGIGQQAAANEELWVEVPGV
ncbi:SMC-Scp complex subunit ScpB [Mesorhizobium sp. M0208]|uniref:SMC-Scp complex subunit ScpB n=1 Tax=unclassified Mesorhizobium TaxID=325217 RepID=UPI00333D285A